jgi:tripartite-type tricarboxylate transporter receptor subunit TctC
MKIKQTLCRAAIASLALAYVVGVNNQAHAGSFPEDNLTLVVNWGPGGGMDRAGRLVAEYAKRRINVPIAVINVQGAGGSTGVRHVADAKPDGYTVGILGASLVASQYLNANANAVEDVDMISFFGPDPAALEVRADTGIKSVKEYIAKVKADPSSIKNGNDAPGGTSHIAAALLESATNIKLRKVPYKGYSKTVAAVMSGEVNSATLPVNQLLDQHKVGEVRILGVMGTKRHFMAPDVPTFKEQGIDLVAGDWRAIYLPKGVPADRRSFLEKVFFDTMNDPEFQEAATKAGYVITPMNADDSNMFVRNFDESLYPILLDAGLVKTRMK